MMSDHNSVRRALCAFAMLLACSAVRPPASFRISGEVAAQERGPQAVSAQDLQSAIDRLGNLDFDIRMNASRTIRRAPAAQAVPALSQAVTGHADGYVRFRALVLLTGFNDPRTADVVRGLLDDPNDRLREVAYAWYESHPSPGMIPQLLQLLEHEQGEFLRPALIRALAAQGSDPRVRDTLLTDVRRGQDFFRSVVIEALGDFRATYAVQSVIDVAMLDGPLQRDAVIALGRIGDERALDTLAALQRSASRENQPAIATAICLLGVNCAAHETYLADTLQFTVRSPGFQQLLRGTATAVSALATHGNQSALQLLLDVGIPSENPARAPLALAVASVALKNTPLLLATLNGYSARDGAIALLAEGFDVLEEDLQEERFFVAVRHEYWQAADGSTARAVAEALIQKLEF
jgi:HEAT repeat protein